MVDNFYLLKDHWASLYKHAHNAERNTLVEPEAACVQMRCFIEVLVGILYRKVNLSLPEQDNLFNRLDSQGFRDLVGNELSSKLHAVRILGNKAAHGKSIEKQVALDLLKDVHLIGHWFHSTISGSNGIWPEFKPIPDSSMNPSTTSLDQSIYDLNQLQQEEILAPTEKQSTDNYDTSIIENIKSGLRHTSDLLINDNRNWASRLSLEDSFSEYKLNNGQQNLVRSLEAFLSSNEQNVFFLKGYAGTGKTFVTKGLTEYLRSIGRNYLLAAPTGKAAKVLSSKTGSFASTIHKAIYSFKEIREYKEVGIDGSETYKYYADLAVNNVSVDTVYIIDESSMIADVYQEGEFFRFGSGYLLTDLLKFINLDHNDHRKKIIFIGDTAQLPPVGMNTSPALSEKYFSSQHNLKTIGFELNEIVRQKSDSGVIHNSLILRNAINENVFNSLVLNFDYDDVHSIYYDAFMAEYLKACANKISAETIVIAYSNSDVAAYNQRIRQHFFPGATELQPRDKIIAVGNNNQNGHLISNGDFGMIKAVNGAAEIRKITIKRRNEQTKEVESILVELVFRDVEVGFRSFEGEPIFFRCKIIESLLESDQPSLSSDEHKALYVDFCIRHPDLIPKTLEFKECIRADSYFNALKIKFGYAITCHKAQGSEWQNVFVKCKTHINQLSADYFRWFYTAITRTSSQLYMIDPPKLKLGAGLKQVPIVGQSILVKPSHISNALAEATTVPLITPIDTAAISFGIPKEEFFLTEIFNKVLSLISGTEYKIYEIEHTQYKEIYYFTFASEVIRVDIGYNGKRKISSIVKSFVSESSARLELILAPLKGQIISNDPVDQKDFTFAQEFLKEFHSRVVELCQLSQITIDSLVQQQWCQRYKFRKEQELAVFDIWYNSKNQFTKFQPVISACTPGILLSDINALLTEGLSS